MKKQKSKIKEIIKTIIFYLLTLVIFEFLFLNYMFMWIKL